MIHRSKNKRGFTLLEVLVSVFIFLIVMLTISTVFTRELVAFRATRDLQRNLENAQFAMNFVSKTLRTSILSAPQNPTSAQQTQEIYAYDFSQDACFRFSFENDSLVMDKNDGAGTGFGSDRAFTCQSGISFDARTELTSGVVSGSFVAAATQREDTDAGTQARIGWVTMSLNIAPDENLVSSLSGQPVSLQSTVSLRDFGNADLTY